MVVTATTERLAAAIRQPCDSRRLVSIPVSYRFRIFVPLHLAIPADYFAIMSSNTGGNSGGRTVLRLLLLLMLRLLQLRSIQQAVYRFEPGEVDKGETRPATLDGRSRLPGTTGSTLSLLYRARLTCTSQTREIIMAAKRQRQFFLAPRFL